MASVTFRECLLFDHQIVEGVARQCLYVPAIKLALFSNGEVRRVEQCPTAARTNELMGKFLNDHEASDPVFNALAETQFDLKQKREILIHSSQLDSIIKRDGLRVSKARTQEIAQQVKNLFKELAKNGF